MHSEPIARPDQIEAVHRQTSHRELSGPYSRWIRMANRKERAATAAETLEILDQGSYSLEDRTEVAISGPLANAQSQTLLYTPDSVKGIAGSLSSDHDRTRVFAVSNCTTFAAAKEMVDADAGVDPLCLNFASAKNPGGGFLSGSQAQEECLARASGLYACLSQKMAYYQANRGCPTELYTDHIIYSPRVPVFRDDSDRLIGSPYLVSIITAPAVNAGAVRKNEPENVCKIAPTMQRRIEFVLAIARHHGHTQLVLGAWGCGVFANDPADVAEWFHGALTQNPLFKNAFDRVVFAVLDRTEDQTTFRAFHDRFAP